MNQRTQVAATALPIETRRPAQILITLMPDSDNDSLLRLAQWLAKERSVLLVGIVPVKVGENLSAGASHARRLRELMGEYADRVHLRAKPRIRVSYTPWDEVLAVLAKHKRIDLLVLNWPHQVEALGLTPAQILSHPPCDVAILRGPLPDKLDRIVVPMRGGPHAERALQLALELSRFDEAKVTALRLNGGTSPLASDISFAGMELVLAELPHVERFSIQTQDQCQAILDASKQADMVILGTSAWPAASTASFGTIADTTLLEAESSVIAVKTQRVAMPEEGTRFGGKAISILVDRWFAENTFHADEFADLEYLIRLKEERESTISLALPALNEESTVGNVIHAAERVCVQQFPLLDEIILIDSNSSDRTREIAADLGVPVYIHQELLPEYGAREGKGEALWKSLYVTSGDIVIWVDTDVTNFHPRFIYGQLGPLLQRNNLQFVKGFYRRPLSVGKKLKKGRGGRVTELTARPLLNLFYPELSGIVQPLSGEYGGRRELLEQLPFASGYGVEIGLLMDVLERAHLASIGQVDMVERVHSHQSLEMLSKMSFAIIQTFFGKLEQRHGLEMLQDVNRTMKRVRLDRGQLRLQVEEVVERQRPPMITIPEYRQKRGLPLLASDEETVYP
jgi:glucosyl-3-phosphoglycerate synthase